MGAIAGTIEWRGETVHPEAIVRQAGVMQHREYGGGFQFSEGPVGLAYVGLGLPGDPLCGNSVTRSEDRRLMMVACGSIHNHASVSASLSRAGHAVKGLTNHELMLRAFQVWGVEAFSRFDGGFALAIWDSVSCELVLARDPLGLRQLFFFEGAGYFLFASEAKAIFCDTRVSREPDPIGIANYLAVNRFLFLERNSFYQGILRLAPGEYLKTRGNGVTIQRYWDVEAGQHDFDGDDVELVEYVRDLMLDAVKIRSTPEGTGAALSGGFDSSSIVCMLSRHRQDSGTDDQPLHTFSFNFGSDDADEIDIIDAVAAATHATHHHIDGLTPALLHDLDDLMRVHDGPVIESSVLLLWAKKREAQANGVRVLLSGLGGDEVFMGTLHYLSDLLKSGRLTEFYRAFRSAYPIDLSSGRHMGLWQVLKAYVLSPLIPHWVRQVRRKTEGNPFPPPWMSPDLARTSGFAHRLPYSQYRSSGGFEQQQLDLFAYELLGGPIPCHEEASAVHGIDTRFPLLDLRLVRLMFSLDRRWKLDGPVVRRMQRAAMKEFLPPIVQEDHLKKNFHHALHRYTHELYSKPFREYLSSGNIRGAEYLDMLRLRELGDDYLSGKSKDPTALWLAFNLEKWLATF